MKKGPRGKARAFFFAVGCGLDPTWPKPFTVPST
jgi:hypothetical protein